MARKLKPLEPEIISALAPGCASCVFWESAGPIEYRCGAVCDPDLLRRWVDDVSSEWGAPGRVAYQDDEALGFIKYAPAKYFPRAYGLPSGVPAEDAALIACIHIDPGARHYGLGKVLLQAAYRDLLGKGFRAVEVFATTGSTDESPMIGMEYLKSQGFKVVAPHPAVPRMRLDLKTLAVWTENLEAVLESLRLPMRSPNPAGGW